MSNALLYSTKIQGYLPAKVLFKWKVYFEDKKKQSMDIPKGTLMVSNHKKLLDMPLYLIMFFKTPMRFLVGDAVYTTTIGFVTWFLNGIHAIRVNKSTMDFSFIEESIQALKKGDRLCIFPEGQLPRNGKMSRFTPSYVMIALGANAEIIPVFTDGNYHITKRAHVMIGERINLRDYCKSENPTREEIQMCNDLVLAKIVELGEKLEKLKEQEKSK